MMTFGYHCEECNESVWPATSRSELAWLRDRQHIVREVARHVQAGLDTWITEGLEFLDHHGNHDVRLARKP